MRALRLIPVLALIVGVLLIVQGLLGILAPDAFVGVVRLFQSPSMVYVAAALRIAIGIVLLCAVSGSRLPIFLRILGSIIVLGGALTPFVGVRFGRWQPDRNAGAQGRFQRTVNGLAILQSF